MENRPPIAKGGSKPLALAVALVLLMLIPLSEAAPKTHTLDISKYKERPFKRIHISPNISSEAKYLSNENGMQVSNEKMTFCTPEGACETQFTIENSAGTISDLNIMFQYSISESSEATLWQSRFIRNAYEWIPVDEAHFSFRERTNRSFLLKYNVTPCTNGTWNTTFFSPFGTNTLTGTYASICPAEQREQVVANPTQRTESLDRIVNGATTTDILHGTPTSYWDGSQYSPISTSIQELAEENPLYLEDYRTGVEQGAYKAYFKPDADSEWPILAQKDGHTLKIKPFAIGYYDDSWGGISYIQIASKSIGIPNRNSITYPNIFTGTDIRYDYESGRFKEYIILKQEFRTLISGLGLPQDTQIYFVFELDIQGLTPTASGEQLQNGEETLSSIDFLTPQGEKAYSFLPSSASDSGKALINEVEVPYPDRMDMPAGIFQSNGRTFYASTLPLYWLERSAYPIEIDPTTQFTDSLCLEDVTAYQSWNSEFQIKWDISNLAPGGEIINATLCLLTSTVFGDMDTGANVSHIYNQSWTESISGVEFMALGYDNITQAYNFSTKLAGWHCINITQAVQAAYNSSLQNFSFRINNPMYQLSEDSATIDNNLGLIKGNFFGPYTSYGNCGGGSSYINITSTKGTLRLTHLDFNPSQPGIDADLRLNVTCDSLQDTNLNASYEWLLLNETGVDEFSGSWTCPDWSSCAPGNSTCTNCTNGWVGYSEDVRISGLEDPTNYNISQNSSDGLPLPSLYAGTSVVGWGNLWAYKSFYLGNTSGIYNISWDWKGYRTSGSTELVVTVYLWDANITPCDDQRVTGSCGYGNTTNAITSTINYPNNGAWGAWNASNASFTNQQITNDTITIGFRLNDPGNIVHLEYAMDNFTISPLWENSSYGGSTNVSAGVSTNIANLSAYTASWNDTWRARVICNDSQVFVSDSNQTMFQETECGNIGEDTYMTKNISATATCFNISADNIFFDCAGYTLTGDNGQYEYGITVYGRNNITIRNCNISSFEYGIYINNTNNSWVHDNIIHDNIGAGYRTGVYASWLHNNSFENNTITSMIGEDGGDAVGGKGGGGGGHAYGFFFSTVYFPNRNNATNNTFRNNTITNLTGGGGGNGAEGWEGGYGGNAMGIYLLSMTVGTNYFLNNSITNLTGGTGGNGGDGNAGRPDGGDGGAGGSVVGIYQNQTGVIDTGYIIDLTGGVGGVFGIQDTPADNCGNCGDSGFGSGVYTYAGNYSNLTIIDITGAPYVGGFLLCFGAGGGAGGDGGNTTGIFHNGSSSFIALGNSISTISVGGRAPGAGGTAGVSHGFRVTGSHQNNITNTAISNITDYDLRFSNSENNSILNCSFNKSKFSFPSSNATIQWYFRVQVIPAVEGVLVNISDTKGTPYFIHNYTGASGFTNWTAINESYYSPSENYSLNNYTINISGTGFFRSVSQNVTYSQTLMIRQSECETIITNTTLASNLSSSGTCITFGADDICLDCNGFYISGNNDIASYGVYASDRTNITIRNCYIRNYTSGIIFSNTNISRITNNTIYENNDGINFSYSYNNSIYENTIPWNSKGVFINSSDYNNFSNNTIRNNDYGVFLNSSDSNYFLNESLYESPSGVNNYSIYFNGSTQNVFENSTTGYAYLFEITSNQTSINNAFRSSDINMSSLAWGGGTNNFTVQLLFRVNVSYYLGGSIENASVNTSTVSGSPAVIENYTNSGGLSQWFILDQLHVNSTENHSLNNYTVNVSKGDTVNSTSLNITSDQTHNVMLYFSECTNVTVDTTLIEDISSDGTCITFGADDIYLNCDGYRIMGNGSWDAGYGTYAEGRTGITIENCIINDYNISIYLNSTNNSLLVNNTLNSSSTGLSVGSSQLNNIFNNTFISNTRGVELNSSARDNSINSSTFDSSIAYDVYVDGAYNNTAYNISTLDRSKTYFGTCGTGCNLSIDWPVRLYFTDAEGDPSAPSVLFEANDTYDITVFSGGTDPNPTAYYPVTEEVMSFSENKTYNNHTFYGAKGSHSNSTPANITGVTQVNISLPFIDCKNLNHSVTLNSNVTTDESCFRITESNVTLDCNGYTISFGLTSDCIQNGICYPVSGVYVPYTNVTNVTIKNCILDETAGGKKDRCGIGLTGSNHSVFNNTITMWTQDSIGISAVSSGGNFSIYGNNISSDQGKGIRISSYFSNGSLYQNTIDVSGGGDVGLDTASTTFNMLIYENNVTVSNSASTGMYIASNDSLVYDNMVNGTVAGIGIIVSGGSSSLSNTSVYNNNVSLPNAGAIAFRLQGASGPDVYIYGNTIETDGTGINFLGGDYYTVYNSTIPSNANISLISTSYDNVLLNSTFNRSAVNTCGTSSCELYIKWYASVNVTNSSGDSIQGATVTVYDISDNAEFTDITTASGLTGWYPVTEELRTGVANTTYADVVIASNVSSMNSTYFSFTNNTLVNMTLYDNTCGVMTEDRTLEGDLLSPVLTCITFGANNLTLDCNGHTITGGNRRYVYAVDTSEYDNLVIRNCRINNFSKGIIVNDSQGVNMYNNTIYDGFLLASTFYDNATGIRIENSSYVNVTNHTDWNITVNRSGALNVGGYGYGILAYSVDHIIIDNYTAENHSGDSHSGAGGGDPNGVGFTTGTHGFGVDLRSVSNFSGNNINVTNMDEGFGIYVHETCYSNITFTNIITGSSGAGINTLCPTNVTGFSHIDNGIDGNGILLQTTASNSNITDFNITDTNMDSTGVISRSDNNIFTNGRLIKGSNGFYIDEGSGNTFENILIQNVTYAFYRIGGSDASYGNKFQNITINNSFVAFEAYWTYQNRLYNVTVDNSTTILYYWLSSNNNITDSIFYHSPTTTDMFHIQVSLTNDIFLNTTANYSNVSWSAPGNFLVQWYTRVNVTNASGDPLQNVIVNVSDVNGTPESANGLTNVNGLINYVGASDINYTHLGNFSHNNHTINVSLAGYYPNTTSFNISGITTNGLTINLTLSEIISNCGTITSDTTLLNSISTTNTTCFTIASDDITLDCNGYTITGNNTRYAYAIDTNSSNNVIIRNCRINNFSKSIVVNNSQGVNLYNNTIYDGFLFAPTFYDNVEAIYLRNSSYVGISNFTTWNLTMDRNSQNNVGGYAYGIYADIVDHLVISNYTAENYSGDYHKIDTAWFIGYGIRFKSVSNATVTNVNVTNMSSMDRYGYGISISQTCYSNISIQNFIVDNVEHGISSSCSLNADGVSVDNFGYSTGRAVNLLGTSNNTNLSNFNI
ncbi:MAG: right-handed parallel beta-helix repeat-containing protein, partial [Candidatus Micrarchaeota archaeon]